MVRRRKILFLANSCPYPALELLDQQSSIRNSRIIELLLEDLEVELLCFRNHCGEATLAPSLLPGDLRLTQIERETSPLWKQVSAFLRPQAMSLYSETMEKALRERA